MWDRWVWLFGHVVSLSQPGDRCAMPGWGRMVGEATACSPSMTSLPSVSDTLDARSS